MKTTLLVNRSVWMASFTAATLAVVTMSFAGVVHARDNVYWSVGVGSPGVDVNVANAFPVYTQPPAVYVQPQPVYVQPQPVYIQRPPVYVQPQPIYVQPRSYYYNGPPQVIYVQPGQGYRHSWNKRHGGDRDYRGDDRGRSYRQGQGPGQGYGSVYYQR